MPESVQKAQKVAWDTERCSCKLDLCLNTLIPAETKHNVLMFGEDLYEEKRLGTCFQEVLPSHVTQNIQFGSSNLYH